jgi:hypothetical protein
MRPDLTIECGDWLTALAAQAVQIQRLWDEHQARELRAFVARHADTRLSDSVWLTQLAPHRLALRVFALSTAVQFAGRQHREATLRLRPLNLGAELRHESSAENQSRLTLTIEQVPPLNTDRPSF